MEKIVYKNENPWYTKKSPTNVERKIRPEYLDLDSFQRQLKRGKESVAKLVFGISAIALSTVAGVFLALATQHDHMEIGYIALSALLIFLSLVLLIFLIGQVCLKTNHKYLHELPFQLGVMYIKGEIKPIPSQKALPASEIALYHFVNQVKAYANEKSFLKTKANTEEEPKKTSYVFSELNTSQALIKRRWNDVLDTLNEFEIFLSQDNKQYIQNLLEKQSILMDVSQVFRDVAETFDTTWRRRGINIEAAIVSPLKIKTNESLLRRILVGPWRTCAYLAHKGSSVVFSAKSEKNVVEARWECDGLTLSSELISTLLQSDLSINERIEMGLDTLCVDANHSPNTLFALISFVTWADLANQAFLNYSAHQSNDGFVISLRFKS
jgi:hypothetical protein